MVLLLLLALLQTAHPATVPPTHEALWTMKRVSSPLVSPDGKWVLFTLTEPSYQDGESRTDLWLVAADGSSGPRRLTHNKAAESGARWSPDSRRIVFTARREGDSAAQAYILNLAEGGEAQRVTSLSSGVSSPQFSPDGKQLLFSSRVYPQATSDEEQMRLEAEHKARKYNARVYESFPIRYWDRWLDGLQPRIFVQSLEEGAKPRDLLAGSLLVKEKGFGGILSNSGEDLSPVWSPDGKFIVFTATTNRNGAAFEQVRTSLYRVSAAGGEAAAFTSGDSYYSPVFAPSGDALFALREPHNGKVYNQERLVRFSWPDPSAPVTWGEKLDRPIRDFAPSVDGRTVYVAAEDTGLQRIFAFSPNGDVRLISRTAAGVYGNLSTPGKSAQPALIALWSSSVRPAEIVRVDPNFGGEKQLTSFTTEQAEALDWQPPRHFTFTSSRGRLIHSMVFLPPRFEENRKYPLLVLIHGGPHSSWRDEISLRWNYHLLAQPGYVVLATNYTGSTGFGEKFAQLIQGDPLAGPAAELNEAADQAIKQFPFIDASRQCAGGASYGGHLANWLQGHTTRYRCLISHAGLINLESQWGASDVIYHRELSAGTPVWEQGPVWKEQNPIRFAQNFQTPILVTVGERDFRVPLSQTLENWSVLQRRKVPSRLIVFPDANHWILKPQDSLYFYAEVRKWLEKYLGN